MDINLILNIIKGYQKKNRFKLLFSDFRKNSLKNTK